MPIRALTEQEQIHLKKALECYRFKEAEAALGLVGLEYAQKHLMEMDELHDLIHRHRLMVHEPEKET